MIVPIIKTLQEIFDFFVVSEIGIDVEGDVIIPLDSVALGEYDDTLLCWISDHIPLSELGMKIDFNHVAFELDKAPFKVNNSFEIKEV